ncbi:MAG TPA: xanthine dehydrogenase family protein molybdopterin-binding subunit, partial [Gammaproteobacteria bacterium]|nr:xanthine dehydrogenase family protein molybdopterin-binding subunit [Gammaproteobacteria bacterium]
MNLPADPGRRRFLKTTLAGGGLTLAFCLPLGGCGRGGDGEPAGAAPFRPNAWLQIEPDGTTTVFLAEAEMGQGVYTSIPMLVAEELDADWQHIRLQRAPLEPEYGAQRTGGSTSVRDGWDTLR